MSEINVIGQDMGMGENKLCGKLGGVKIRSAVAADSGSFLGNTYGFKNQSLPPRIAFDQMRFIVGQGTQNYSRVIENLDYDRLDAVPETRALFYASVTEYIKEHGEILSPVSIYVGLPLAALSGNSANENAKIVKRWMTGRHTWEADEVQFSIEIKKVVVASQPAGAYFDYIVDDEGAFIADRKADMKGELGVISIGFNTVEILTVQDNHINHGMSEGETYGVRRLLELRNPGNQYFLSELDEKLRRNPKDFQEQILIWGREVTGQIEKIWGTRWKRFSRIILVGGGVHLIGDMLQEKFEGKCFIPEDPVLAISRGLYKFGLSKEIRYGKNGQ